MKTYTRNDLAADIGERLALPVSQARSVVDQALDAIAKALADGKRVEFRHFGTLEPVQRKPKVGRNPMNAGAGLYHIPARRMVRFRASGHLFNLLNPDQTA